MKNLILILSLVLPLLTFAGNGDKKEGKKNNKTEIEISTGKDGKIIISGLKAKDLKKLEKDIKAALKNISVNVTDGEEKHTVHLKAEINIE